MRKRGFTLVELMVVIAIIGILASIVLTSLSVARYKGRNAKRISDMKNMQLALEEYYNQNANYPYSTTLLLGTYMSILPKDPSTNADYPYYAYTTAASSNCTSSGGVGYHLGAALESTNSNTGAASMTPAVPGGDTICNGGTGGVSGFTGTADNCIGTTAGSLNNCYDVTNTP